MCDKGPCVSPALMLCDLCLRLCFTLLPCVLPSQRHDAGGHRVFLLLLLPPVLLLCVFTAVFLFSPSVCVCVCCLCEGVCDSGTVKSDVWDAKGGIVPYLSASPAPAVWSRRPRLLLPPLSSWLFPLSLCGGLCCHPSFPPFLPAFLSVHVFFWQQLVAGCFY